MVEALKRGHEQKLKTTACTSRAVGCYMCKYAGVDDFAIIMP